MTTTDLDAVVRVTPAPQAIDVVAKRAVARLADDVWRIGLELTAGDEAAVFADPLALDGRLLEEPIRWSGFSSSWGGEFEPIGGDWDGGLLLRGTSGRSSHGTHPWLGLQTVRGAVLLTVAYSGNWRIEVDADGRIRAGVDDTVVDLAAREHLAVPEVLVAVGPDVDSASVALTRAVGRHLVPRSVASDALLTEWNHWWSYEDVGIDEAVFLQNAALAADAGLDVAVLDAGWFGPAQADAAWTEHRGDWDQVNSDRFPSGLSRLADGVRRAGAGFGIWQEPEAVGAKARLRADHPELLALRTGSQPHHPSITVSLDPQDPSFLGYVCLGSPAGRAFVAQSLHHAVVSTGAKWLKLDFNVDPGAGCDRTDHGHGARDGLLRHCLGLYDVLDAFRVRHPEVVLEACASGGLRLDLGIAQHVHCLFLSDPDWTEHHLQVLWGASTMLPPSAMLHWSWSSWRGDHPDQRPDPVSLSTDAFAATLRAAMLHRFGVSLPLPELSPALQEVLAQEVRRYGETVRPFVRHGTLRRLTAQPLRHGRGERVPAFQLDVDDRHLVAGFVLPGGVAPATQPVRGLDPDRSYGVRLLQQDGASARVRGAALMVDGVPLPAGASSWLAVIEP